MKIVPLDTHEYIEIISAGKEIDRIERGEVSVIKIETQQETLALVESASGLYCKIIN